MATARGWPQGRLAVAVATALVAVLFLGLAGLLASARFDALLVDTVKADVERNRRNLLAGVDRLRVVAVVEAVDERIVGHPDRGRPGVYLVVAPDGAPVTGNLSGWPPGLPFAEGFHLVRLEGAGLDGRALVHVEQVPGGWWLAVGRSIAAWDAFRAQLAWLGAGVAGLVLLAAVGIAVLAGRRSARDVAAMNAGLQAFRAGDLGRRLGDGQADAGLRALAGGVDRTMDHVERLVRGMQRLSGTVAHELKSPLARAARRLAEGDAAAARGELDETLALVDQLLDIAANETAANSGAVACDLADVVQQVGGLYGPVADAAGVQLRLEAGRAVALADPDLMARALSNLVDNAIRATPVGAEVVLASGESDGRPFLSVADGGLGPAAADVSELVARARPGLREDGSRSSGLGLRLVQAIALRHGASLSVEWQNPGHRLTISLPPAPM